MHTAKMSTLHIEYTHHQNSATKPKSFMQIIPFSIVFVSIITYLCKYCDVFFKHFIATHEYSNIFATTKFWFLVSNVIILIIAADFGAFRSKLDGHNYKDYSNNINYDQYQQQNDQMGLSLVKLQTPKIVESVCSNKADDDDHCMNEEIKDIVVYKETKSSEYTMASDDIIAKSDVVGNKNNTCFKENNTLCDQLAPKVLCDRQLAPKVDQKNDQENKKEPPRRVLSVSKGDIKEHKEKKKKKKMNVLYRSKTEKIDDEENEFSSMSNEELNRRVEEFIEKCNTRIRLEGVARRFEEV